VGRLLLVRHGQASWGQADYDRLSALGERQSTVLGEALASWGWRPDRVVVGAMVRHQQTARAALAAMGQPVVWTEDPRWNEFDHMAVLHAHRPAWRSRTVMMADLARTGRPRRAFQEVFDAALDRWVAGELDRAVVERFGSFRARVLGGLRALAAGPGDAIVFTSGGPISAVVADRWSLDGAGWRGVNRVMTNTGVTRLVVGRSGVTLVTVNADVHLDGVEGLRTYR